MNENQNSKDVSPNEAAAIIALASVGSVDDGLSTAQKVIGFIVMAGFSMRALTGSDFITEMSLFASLVIGFGYLAFCRMNQEKLARGLIKRFGAARFTNAQPIVEKANDLLQDCLNDQ